MALSIRTLLFSDIENSTSLLDRAGVHYPVLLGEHRAIVRAAVARAGGVEHGTEGDSFFLSFDSPTACLAAALEAQRAIETHPWPDGLRLRVRMGAHIGEVQDSDGDLVGMSIHHAARIAAAAYGGQILLSEAVRGMARVLPDGAELRPLGTHRLRDIGTVALFQLDHADLQSEFPLPRGVLGYRTNLPRRTTWFVGGEALLAAIAEHLDQGAVVTLTGTGGVGKTRAAMEFGRRHLDEFDQGVFFVDLAPVADTGSVVGVLAATLPLAPGGDGSLLDTVIEWIGERRLLLLIDNCEHLVTEVGEIVEQLLAGAPNLVMLATSREPLGVPGERVHRVPSLEHSAAVALLCERAMAIDETFVADGHVDVLVAICDRLDGIPLAIELAAARMRSLSPEQLLDRLQDRFRLLRGSGRSTLDRHQTLRATVSWSYQLLTDDERLLFDRASVFAGGFDLRSAESVCGFDPIDPTDVVDLVTSLVDKSMIVAERRPVGMRYRLLETLRQYGEEQVELRGETAPLRDRHAEHYCEVTAELDHLGCGPHEREAAERTSIDWDNVRAAHLWALAQGDLCAAEQIVDRTFRGAVISMRQEHAEMLRRTMQLGDELGKPSTNVLGMLGYWLDMQGDTPESWRLAQRGIDLAPSPEDPVTGYCWSAFAGASTANEAQSPQVQEAFRHQAAAVTNITGSDVDWFGLVCLVDSSMHADLTATPALRQELHELAVRRQSTRLATLADQYEGHMCLTSSPPNIARAMTLYRRIADITASGGDLQFHGVALRSVAMAATALDAPGALVECHEALEALFEIRYWQKIWQTLESVTLALAQSGRTQDAAVILGHLDSHSVGSGFEHGMHFREKARALIAADCDHSEAEQLGARMSAEEVVTTALTYCSGIPAI